MAEHFTAVIRVTKTVETEDNTVTRGTPSAKPTERKVYEVTNLTVRASSLDKLRDKVAAHVQLIDDDAVGSASEGKTLR